MLYRLELACVQSAGRVADYSQELSVFRALSSLASAVAPDRNPGMLPGASESKIKLIFDDRSGILLGGQVSGGSSVGELIRAYLKNKDQGSGQGMQRRKSGAYR